MTRSSSMVQALPFALLLLAAALTSRGVSALLVAALATADVGAFVRSAYSDARPPAARLAGSGIATSGLFGRSRDDISRRAETPACGESMRLVAIARTVSSVARSLAVVRDESGRSTTVAVGDRIGARVTSSVSSIGTREIVLRPEGSDAPCVLEMGAAPRPSGSVDALVRGSDGAFSVDRAIVEQLRASPDRFLGRARGVPTARGVRLYGLQSSALATQLGLRDGDIVTSVNGLSMARIDEVLGAVQMLETAQTLHVALERGGRPLTMQIAIEDARLAPRRRVR